MNIKPLDSEQIKIRYIEDYKSDLRVLWKEISETFHENRVILDCDADSLQSLILTAKEFKMLGSFKV